MAYGQKFVGAAVLMFEAAFSTIAISKPVQNPPPFDLQFFGDTYVPSGFQVLKKSGQFNTAIFGSVAPLIASSRANIVNFEGVETSSFFSKEWKWHLLRSNTGVLELLRYSGITGVTLANNHAMDFGYQGLFDSIFYSRKAGLLVAGAGTDEDAALQPMIVSSAQSTYCIFAVSRTYPMSFWATPHRPGSATISMADAGQLPSKCTGTDTFAIASVHWGRELSKTPQDYQRTMARALIDGGAIAVIGHHPHVLQEIEVYKGRPIFYSIGNFAFGTLTGPGRQEGAAVAVRREGNDKFSFRVTALNVDNTQVQFAPRLFKQDESDPLTPLISKVKGCQKMAASKSFHCVFEN